MQNAQSQAGGKLLRKGSRGDDVRDLQQKLQRLGFDLKVDGIFGDDTEKAVIQLQSMFGYTVDALVGDGTQKLIDAQIGYGWNAKAPDAAEKALAAQGKGTAQSKPAQPMQQQKAAPQKPATNAPMEGQAQKQMPQKQMPQKQVPQKPTTKH